MESLASLVIRPDRAEYNPEKDLGPKEFFLDGKSKQRIDYEIKNDYGHKLKCSLFVPGVVSQKYQCVVYCHGNSGSRVDALECVDLLLPLDVVVASFDFSGSGLSEGKYVTLGYNEKDDLKCVIKYLRSLSFISEIAIWGRSMGASTALLYSATDPNIVALCLDSPFSDLNQLCTDLMNSKTFGFLIGGLFFGSAKKHIKKKANFNIDDVSPVNVVKKCTMPSLFIHGKKDKIVPINHSRTIFQAYPGQTKIHELELDHNDPRPKWIKQEIKSFFQHKFAEAVKKREFNSNLTDKLKEKVDNDDIDAKKAHELIKKLVYAGSDNSKKDKENNSGSGKKMQDLLPKSIIYNPLSIGFINNKYTGRTVTNSGDNSDSDSDDGGYNKRNIMSRKPYQDSNDSDTDEKPNFFRKKMTRPDSDSEDSGDENTFAGPRVSNMADFLKFQRKKMPILQNKILNRHRGSSMEQNDDDLAPKGFQSKRNAMSYNSDTE